MDTRSARTGQRVCLSCRLRKPAGMAGRMALPRRNSPQPAPDAPFLCPPAREPRRIHPALRTGIRQRCSTLLPHLASAGPCSPAAPPEPFVITKAKHGTAAQRRPVKVEQKNRIVSVKQQTVCFKARNTSNETCVKKRSLPAAACVLPLGSCSVPGEATALSRCQAVRYPYPSCCHE